MARTKISLGDQTDLNTGGQDIIGLPTTPGGPTSASSKAYVDAVAAGLKPKGICRVGTAGAIVIATGLIPGQVIDDITLVAGDRVLVMNQGGGSSTENGIYVSGAVPARSTDMVVGSDAVGAYCWVDLGTVNGNIGYVEVNNPGVVGTNALAFTQFGVAGYEAGVGIQISGKTVEVMNIPIVRTDLPEAIQGPTGFQFAFPPLTKLSLSYSAPDLTLTIGFQPPSDGTWTASTPYAIGQQIIPTVPNGFLYECVANGNTGMFEPTFPTTLTNEVPDNTTRWRCEEVRSYSYWWNGNQFTKVEDDFASIVPDPGKMYAAYYNPGTLTIEEYSDPTFLLSYPAVSIFSWDTTSELPISIADLRYGTNVPRETVLNMVFGNGTLTPMGDAKAGTLTNPNKTGSSANEVDFYVKYDPGFSMFVDRDVIVPVSPALGCTEILNAGGLGNEYSEIPILYVSASEIYNVIPATVHPIHYVAAGNMHYNSGPDVTTAVPNCSYVAMYVIISNDVSEPYKLLMGQRYDTTLDAARINNITGNLSGDLLPRMEHAFRIIYYVDGVTITNPGNAYAVEIAKATDDGLFGGSTNSYINLVYSGVNKSKSGCAVDGNGIAITTGIKGAGATVVVGEWTITGWVIVTDQAATSNIVWDVKRATPPDPPGDALNFLTLINTGAGGVKPTKTAGDVNARLAYSADVDHWSLALHDGEFLEFSLDSVDGTVTKCVLTLLLSRTPSPTSI